VARNLLITQGKPAGLSLAPSRHRNASYRRRYVTNRRNINANGVLFSAVVGGSLISKADRPTLAFPNLHSPPKEWVPHVPTLGHGIARTCRHSPFPHFGSALLFYTFLFCTFLDAFRRASTTASNSPIHPPAPSPTRALLPSTEFLCFLMPSLCDSSFPGLL
jgi:hypothetical protein